MAANNILQQPREEVTLPFSLELKIFISKGWYFKEAGTSVG